ncbi:P44/Msp2 family outer membrane protein [Ehrlichia minasensis]|uniref:P44/Msp2 family outer membrane protein n=1 Tax=Ehrlichia minasensis TaxID=1242993 RepID=A0A4Q6I4B4_9RICK|nr:P44/Msp2 family outer membrane protein [Ehrlichia minasensis]RZB12691.1 P44/Msp2 family outer membrane protein [Ehrlichia minasensis]
MNNKKSLLIGTVLLSLFSSLSIKAFSVINHNDISHNFSGLYFTGQYRPAVSHFSSFTVSESNFATQELVMLQPDNRWSIDLKESITQGTKFSGAYTAKFQDNAASFSGAIGYSYPENLKFEFEVSYEKFDVKTTQGYQVTNTAVFALARKTISIPQDSGNTQNNQYVVMKNSGLSIASIMINSCYDMSFYNLVVSPYICAGIGEDFIKFFDTLYIKLAYQGKLGVNYSLSSRFNIFADVYYHKVIGNQFKNLNVIHAVALTDFPKATSAIATLNVAYFGGEAGIRFIL